MTDRCPTDDPRLDKLPKGSGCENFKKVPARSEYWRSETDEVIRCDKFTTPSGDGGSDGGGGGGGGDDGDGDGDRGGVPDLPDEINGWKLRKGTGDSIVYVAETSRFTYHANKDWKRSDDILVYPTLSMKRGDIKIVIAQVNIDEGRERATSLFGFDRESDAEFDDPHKGVEVLKSWLKNHDPDQHYAPPEPNGFVSVTDKRHLKDWNRSEIPESAEFDHAIVRIEWRYSKDDAPEYPQWDVIGKQVKDGGEVVEETTIREGLPHFTDAVERARRAMENLQVDYELPGSVGPWENVADGDRAFAYRADTGKDVPQQRGKPKRLFKFVHARSTADGWKATLQKGFKGESVSDRKDVEQVAEAQTRVGCAEKVVAFLEENDDVDESQDADGVDIPESVNGWTKISPDNEDFEDAVHTGFGVPIVAWEGEDPVYVFIIERDSKRYDDPYQVRMGGERTEGIVWSDYETLADAVDVAIAKLEEREPGMTECRFEMETTNAIMKPTANLMHWAGGGEVLRNSIETTDNDNVRWTVKITSGAIGSGCRIYIGSGHDETDIDITRHGTVLADTEVFSDTYRKGKKNDDAKLTVSADDSRPKMYATAGGTTRSEFTRRPHTEADHWPEGDEWESSLETTGRELKTALKALSIVAGDDDDVVLDFAGDTAAFVAENDAGERAKASLGEVRDDAKISGETTAAYNYERLWNIARSIPRPASTTVTVNVYDDSHVLVSWTDEQTLYEAYAVEEDELPDYDLSAPATKRLHLSGTGCLSRGESGCMAPALHQPLQAGESVPETPLNLSDGDVIVWTFPKHDGCRCGTQALQLNTLAQERGITVYGIAAAPPEKLEEMGQQLGLDSMTLVSDPDGSVAGELGVEMDENGRLERTLFFVRNGEIQDVTEGMGLPLEQPDADPCLSLPLSQADESKLFEIVHHPGVYLATGKRGSGKSSLAFRIGEGLSERENVTPVTVGLPQGARDEFPGNWVHVEELSQAPPNSVIIVDEAYAKFHARDAMSDDNKAIGKLVNTSRHCGQTYVFVSQNASHLDVNAVSEADGLLMKEPGTFHMEFERRQFRELSERAKEAFDQLPKNLKAQEYTYAYTDEFQGMIQNGEAEFFDDDISKSFASSCSL